PELAGGPQNSRTISWIKCLNLIQEERHGAVVAAQLVFQQKQIEQHLNGDGGAVGFNLPKIMIRVPLVVGASYRDSQREQVGKTDHRVILNLAPKIGDC